MVCIIRSALSWVSRTEHCFFLLYRQVTCQVLLVSQLGYLCCTDQLFWSGRQLVSVSCWIYLWGTQEFVKAMVHFNRNKLLSYHCISKNMILLTTWGVRACICINLSMRFWWSCLWKVFPADEYNYMALKLWRLLKPPSKHYLHSYCDQILCCTI